MAALRPEAGPQLEDRDRDGQPQRDDGGQREAGALAPRSAYRREPDEPERGKPPGDVQPARHRRVERAEVADGVACDVVEIVERLGERVAIARPALDAMWLLRDAPPRGDAEGDQQRGARARRRARVPGPARPRGPE